MPRHKRGTLVMVKPEALGGIDVDTLRPMVGEGGYLYFIEAFRPENSHQNETGSDEYSCKSIANGKSYPFYPYEITTRGATNAKT